MREASSQTSTAKDHCVRNIVTLVTDMYCSDSFNKRDECFKKFVKNILKSKLSSERKNYLKEKLQKKFVHVSPKMIEKILNSIEIDMGELEKATIEVDANKLYEKIIKEIV